jgi:hypothetical protein
MQVLSLLWCIGSGEQLHLPGSRDLMLKTCEGAQLGAPKQSQVAAGHNVNQRFCTIRRWDTLTRKCHRASLLAFAVARPVDFTDKGTVERRDAEVTQVPEASWIYKYGAKKAADIGVARWIAQVRRRAVCLAARMHRYAQEILKHPGGPYIG